MKSVFVITRAEKGDIKEQEVIVDSEEAQRVYKELAKKNKIRAFGGDVFFDSVKDLNVGQELSAGDFNGNRLTVRHCPVKGPKKAARAPKASQPSTDCGCGNGFMCEHTPEGGFD